MVIVPATLGQTGAVAIPQRILVTMNGLAITLLTVTQFVLEMIPLQSKRV